MTPRQRLMRVVWVLQALSHERVSLTLLLRARPDKIRHAHLGDVEVLLPLILKQRRNLLHDLIHLLLATRHAHALTVEILEANFVLEMAANGHIELRVILACGISPVLVVTANPTEFNAN